MSCGTVYLGFCKIDVYRARIEKRKYSKKGSVELCTSQCMVCSVLFLILVTFLIYVQSTGCPHSRGRDISQRRGQAWRALRLRSDRRKGLREQGVEVFDFCLDVREPVVILKNWRVLARRTGIAVDGKSFFAFSRSCFVLFRCSIYLFDVSHVVLLRSLTPFC